tara:strand:- start:821 stop:1066 length:246 start_codon:yes stop_codon:yes gene_type:complete
MDNIQTIKELRDIAAAMATGDRSNQALGAVYDSIMELSYKLQDADIKFRATRRHNLSGRTDCYSSLRSEKNVKAAEPSLRS